MYMIKKINNLLNIRSRISKVFFMTIHIIEYSYIYQVVEPGFWSQVMNPGGRMTNVVEKGGRGRW